MKKGECRMKKPEKPRHGSGAMRLLCAPARTEFRTPRSYDELPCKFQCDAFDYAVRI
jgi:hypothetical protein